MMTSVTTASPCFGTVRPLCFRPVRSQGTTRPGRFTGHSPQPLPETPYLHRATTTGSHVNASPSRCRRGDRPGHTRHPRGCRNAAYKRINHVTPAEMGIQTKSAVTWTHIPEIGSKFHYVDFRIETTNTSDEERKSRILRSQGFGRTGRLHHLQGPSAQHFGGVGDARRSGRARQRCARRSLYDTPARPAGWFPRCGEFCCMR